MTQSIDLTHQFLIAMPGMADPNFSGAVIFVCEHNSFTVSLMRAQHCFDLPELYSMTAHFHLIV